MTAVVLTLENGLPVLVSAPRHDPLGYDFRADIFGSRDSVAVGLDARTPLRSLEEGSSAPKGERYRGFLDRFATSFEAERAAFLDIVRGERENPCPAGNSLPTLRESLPAFRIALACDLSRAEGRPVAVSEIEAVA